MALASRGSVKHHGWLKEKRSGLNWKGEIEAASASAEQEASLLQAIECGGCTARVCRYCQPDI